MFVNLSVKVPGSNLGQGTNSSEDFLDSPGCFQVNAESVFNDVTTASLTPFPPFTMHSYWHIYQKKVVGMRF